MTTHAEALAEIERAQAARTAWFAKWPNACRVCEGHGGDWSSYDPSPAGVSLSPGVMYDFDPCPVCIGSDWAERTETDEEGEPYTVMLGKCPRCAALMPNEGDAPCPACGWNWGQGDDDTAPRVPEYEPQDMEDFNSNDWYEQYPGF